MLHEFFFHSFALRDVKLPAPALGGMGNAPVTCNANYFSILPVSVASQGFSIPVKIFLRIIPVTLELQGLTQVL
jgi:hypothetical protein